MENQNLFYIERLFLIVQLQSIYSSGFDLRSPGVPVCPMSLFLC